MNLLLLLVVLISTFYLNFIDGVPVCQASIFYKNNCGFCLCSRDGRSMTCSDNKKMCVTKKVQPEDELSYENSLLRLKIKKILEEENRKRDNCHGHCNNPHSHDDNDRSKSRSSESRSSESRSSESSSSESDRSRSDSLESKNSESGSSESGSSESGTSHSGSSESESSESGTSHSGSSESGSSESDSSETHRRRGRPTSRPRPRCCHDRRSWDCAHRFYWRC